ncbi:MAG: Stk1 family PASTA domain-containing Ser/Thr kinase [Acidothermaceae bacterium]
MDSTVSDSLVGRVLDGRYRVESRIARGGMATVYRALDVRLDRLVALKVMHQLYAEDDEFVALFIREAKSAARLSHPNVVAVFDQGDDAGHVFLAMEYVQGRTLRDLLRERGHLAPQEALSILQPVLSALSAAHTAGLIHRDVKPENVLLADDGRVKVADFGLARAAASHTVTSTTTLIGTVAYLAPEQVTRGVADARSDVYAAGVVLFEMLTGRPPYDGESPISVAYRHAHEDVPVPSSVVPGIPASVDLLVQRATARDPDQRPVDAGAFLADVMRVRRGLPALESDAGAATSLTPRTHQTLVVNLPEAGIVPADRYVPEPVVDDAEIIDEGYPRRRRRRRRGLIALLIVLLLAAGAGGAGWWYGVGQYTKVPSLQQLSVPDAQAAATKAHLKLAVDPAQQWSSTIPSGEIIDQSKDPGSQVKRGASVTVTVSKGTRTAKVPAFDPKSTAYGDYQKALTAAGFKLAPEVDTFDPSVPKGNVISVEPAAGETVDYGKTVTVTVSKGPQPITITDYEGKNGDDAQAALTAAGFKVTVTKDYNDTIAEGIVITQTPNSGTGVNGDTITLDVSKGQQLFKVPDVRGKKTKQAEQDLSKAGFKWSVLAAPFGPGDVYDQSPEPGTMKPKGTTITLYVV